MIEFLASDYLLKILSNILMGEALICLGIVFLIVVIMVLKGLWRLFNE